MIKNKRGWLKIVESVIAILIVFGVVMYVVSKQNYRPDISEVIYEKQTQILDIVSKNDTLRQLVLDENKDQLQIEISKFVSPSLNFSICISNLVIVCFPEILKDREIYAKEIMVVSTLKEYKPKKLRFFVWMK